MPRYKKTPAHWNPVQIAAYDLVHSFKHGDKTGPQALAPFLGKTPKSLSNEVNADYQAHKFGLDDAVAAELAAGKAPILMAYAQMLNHVCFALPAPDMACGDVELLTKFADWQAAMGQTCMNIQQALDPNGPNGSGISKKEARAIAEAGQAHMTRFMEFLERVKALVE